MSQPPQPRPWFRLASLARPNIAPPPPPAPAPAPRPTFIRPTLTQTFAPPQAPPTQPPSPPQPSVQAPPQPTRPSVTAPPFPATQKTPPTATNPSPKPSSASPVAQSPKPRISAPSSPMPTRHFSPTPSPSPSPSKALPPPNSPIKAASPMPTRHFSPTPSPSPSPSKAPPPPNSPIKVASRLLTPSPQNPKYNEQINPSPKTKHLTPPLSPLTLPPPQLVNSDYEKEQKIVMVHDNRLEKDKHIPTADHYNNHHHTSPTSAHANKEKAIYNNNTPHKKDSEDIGMSVITLAGENKGAIMELTPNSQYPRNGHFAGNRHLNVGNNDKSWSDGEKGASDSEGKMKHKDKNKSAKTSPFHAYTNSNVQGVNNSIMYNSSCTHNDPGVHLSVTRKPKDPNHPHHV